ncbi:hypothetical protein N8I77_007962 [Diaporthe amygdali]|uniref:Zn(2)-C6 fungal-type domain-containing protein n=1 Tax=Phomopsis amygdali TaxID=1214568 RepID=A0AAD9SDW8_PHOAM|nr:hypothetical protein N8I77_007962 [Diaporthe amygdali]
MVYCGKASLGCTSCRKRRIKCDRRQPECTQCIRVSKGCPGYRDQLSLMFRDETVKVEKRVRASWGAEEGNPSSSASSSSEVASRPGPAKTNRSASVASSATSGSINVPTPPSSFASTSPTSLDSPHARSESSSPLVATSSPATALSYGEGRELSKLPVAMTTDPAELGLSFYVKHYIIGYPDEVRRAEDLSSQQWFRGSCSQATMAALGLAGMGNLHNDKQLQHLSRVKYGEALAFTNEALRDSLKNLDTAIRTTIMLALYQCVHNTHESHENVRVHLLGCLALIRSHIPIRGAPAMGIRGVLQLCYSLLVPCITSGMSIPDNFFDWIRESRASDLLPQDEKPGADLVPMIARFAQLNATLRTRVFTDGDESTAHILQQLLAVDADMDEWESSQAGKWRYEVLSSQDLPREAVFRGTYHRYSDVWASRIWSHFRWARLLTNQRILELADNHPRTAAGAVPPGPRQERIRETVRRLAVDVLTSVPTHYRHPRLTWKDLDMVQTHGGAGAGVVGIPHLTFNLRVAACAPGVPYEVWRWALDVLDTVWSDLGMLHAKSLADELRKHRDKLDRADAGRKLKVEEAENAQGECL